MVLSGETVLIVLLVALVVVAGVQTVQLVGLSGALSGGKLVTSTSAAAPTSGSSQSGVSVPSSLQNLPGMVGGC